jgi:hypothetical protein
MKDKNDDFLNLNKDNGGFFSPVKGGHYDGLKFGKWFKHGSRLGLISIFSISTILFSLFTDKTTFDPEWSHTAVAISLGLITGLIVFKTLQHWNDLKNHTSR